MRESNATVDGAEWEVRRLKNTSSKTRFVGGVALLLLVSSSSALIGATNSFAYDDGGKKPKIVFIVSARPGGRGGPQSNRGADYLRVLAAAGLMPLLVTRGDFNEEDRVRAARLALSADPRPTALFAANDLMALGAMTAIRKAIPDDIALMGFDDIFAARVVTPSLSTIQHDLGRVAAKMLLERLNDLSPDSPGRMREMPFEIVRRQSA
jgi:DNA-binding LacI/PurR family transcriptional regulator